MKKTINSEYILPIFLKNLIKFSRNAPKVSQTKTPIRFYQPFDQLNLIFLAIGIALWGCSLWSLGGTEQVFSIFENIRFSTEFANFNQNYFNFLPFRVILLCYFLLILGILLIPSNRRMRLRIPKQSLVQRLVTQKLTIVLLVWLILKGLIRMGVQANFYSLEHNEIIERLIDIGSLLTLIAWLPSQVSQGRSLDFRIDASKSLEPEQRIEEPPNPL